MNRTATIRIERDTRLALARGARGFARALDRVVKSVHRDIHALIEIGPVTKDSKGSVLVPFSRIRTEFDLQPKQAA
jgi:predicted transcriptional regulator